MNNPWERMRGWDERPLRPGASHPAINWDAPPDRKVEPTPKTPATGGTLPKTWLPEGAEEKIRACAAKHGEFTREQLADFLGTHDCTAVRYAKAAIYRGWLAWRDEKNGRARRRKYWVRAGAETSNSKIQTSENNQ